MTHTEFAPSYDPTEAAEQVGFRELTFSLPEAEIPVTLYAWTIVFQQHPISRARYRKLEHLLGQVNSKGFLPETIAGVPGFRMSSMSERTDLLGEYATIWVSADSPDAPERGAVPVALNGVIVHLLAFAPVMANGSERPIHMLDTIGRRIAWREPELLMAHEVNEDKTKSRLPVVDDLPPFVSDGEVTDDWYENRR